jgi:hypothetical protein
MTNKVKKIDFKKLIKKYWGILLVLAISFVSAIFLKEWKGIDKTADFFTIAGVVSAIVIYSRWKSNYKDQKRIDQFEEVILLVLELEVRLELFRIMRFQLIHHPAVIMLRIIEECTNNRFIKTLVNKFMDEGGTMEFRASLLSSLLEIEGISNDWHAKDGSFCVFNNTYSTQEDYERRINDTFYYFTIPNNQHLKYLSTIDDLFVECIAKLRFLKLKDELNYKVGAIRDNIEDLKGAFQRYQLTAIRYKDALFRKHGFFTELKNTYDNFLIISSAEDCKDEFSLKIRKDFQVLIDFIEDEKNKSF